ncbi:molybdate ABC transporter substrate-binding protein [Leptospira kemamanensis]|uniref:Molybdate ABC transporter substrate-binding protein n=1 Tax=Leptospira kemamanensis TaxID=2484942 RepID=A0A4R9JUA5_9LEPT|nr:molybdate ABC transporter substrate-binding protein [Leptospira kemamanensis]TGL55329.1 molybdate ABC transporter substrate-binding protein [Leptospira kemamanensis]
MIQSKKELIPPCFMMRIFWIFFLVLSFAWDLTPIFAETKKADEQHSEIEITVAVAANFKNPMEEIHHLFQIQNPNCKIIYLYGSSGHLTNQIRNGAQIDLFLSADLDFPVSLYKEGFSLTPPDVYAEGRLVLVSNETLPIGDSLSEILTSKQIKYIAIANPKTAPYGKAAMNYLTQLGIWNSIEGKLVYGENVTQVNQFVFTGAADVGFTSFSSVKSKEDQWKNWKKLDPKLVPPIRQGKILIQPKEPHSLEKKRILHRLSQFIGSKEVFPIFQKYGYEIPVELLNPNANGNTNANANGIANTKQNRNEYNDANRNRNINADRKTKAK